MITKIINRIDGAVVDEFTYGMNYPSWVRMVDFAAENNIRVHVKLATGGGACLIIKHIN
ncbi:MAG: hypothetical protein ABFD10_01525 [Prolixibacteraceae bacterium]